MNAKLVLLCCFSAMTAFAADPSRQQYQSSRSTVLQPIPLSESERLQNLMAPRPERSVISFGRSDFVLSGPLIEGFRRPSRGEDLSRGQKLLRLPVVRLFVPQPIPNPPGGGRYFAWRNSAQPWNAAASRPATMRGAEPNITQASLSEFEPSGSFLKVTPKPSAAP